VAIGQSNIVVCPACGSENIEGADTCENCMADLRSIDVPEWAQMASESDLALPISSIRVSRADSVNIGATVRDAVEIMRAGTTGAVVVVDGGNVVGIFTERDVLKKIAGEPGAMEEPGAMDTSIATYMTPDPLVLRDDDMMAVALNKMGDGGFRHIPVMTGSQVTGLVTGRDVMSWVLGRYFD
jgi:CBS domain-containing protein